MKEFNACAELDLPLDAVSELVLEDPRVLNAMYQNNKCVIASPWKNDTRKLAFEMPSGGIPQVVLNVVGGGAIKVDMWQTRRASPDGRSVVITNKVKPKILGAEFVRIRPTLTLARDPDDHARTRMTMNCKMYAIMPPPMNSMLEGAMLHATRLQYAWFTAALGMKT